MGLKITLCDIVYETEPKHDDDPNLYFVVEHPDKSSALLSPPYAKLAYFSGVHATFHFLRDNEDVVRSMHCYPEVDEECASLADSALYALFGVPTRRRMLKLIKFDDVPSVIDFAPTIWNAHYLQVRLLGSLAALSQSTNTGHQATSIHVRNFPVISDILMELTNAQSPSLRKKAAQLLENDRPQSLGHNIPQSSGEDNRGGQGVLDDRLWELVQTTLEPTIGTKTLPKEPSSPRQSNWEGTEPMLPPFFYEPDYTAHLDDRDDTSLYPSPENASSSGWALPQLSVDEHPGYGDNFCDASGQLWGDQDTDADYLLRNIDPRLDDEYQEDGSVGLPHYHTDEQEILQQSQYHYQHQPTSETMDLDSPLDEGSSDSREYIEDDMDVDSLPTSEVSALDEHDNPCFSPCYDENVDRKIKTKDDIWDDNE